MIGKRAASCPEGHLSCLTLHRVGVAWPGALLHPPVVSYTAFSPLLPKERFVSVAHAKHLHASGRYPARYPVVCGLSSGFAARAYPTNPELF